MLDFFVSMCYNTVCGIIFVEELPMKIYTLTRDDVLASNCYIILSGGFFSVIDPSVGYSDASRDIPELFGMTPKYVILTHAHIDHLWEIESYVQKGCAVLVSPCDAEKLNDPGTNLSRYIPGPYKAYGGEYTVVSEGDIIDLGDDRVSVIQTPGHTSGSLSIVGDGVIFTGDTLFSGGAYGRFDFPSGDVRALSESIKRLISYPEDHKMYSGHGDVTDIGSVKKYF